MLRGKHRWLVLYLLVLCPLVSACGGKTSSVSALAPLENAETVTIMDNWSGLSPLTPVETQYTLRKQGAAFQGQAAFSVGGSSGAARRATADLTIPADAMHTFLQLLATAPIREGAYKPKIGHTDDYPNRTIIIDTSAGQLQFVTQSQGQGNVPWGMSFGGHTYVINADTPAKALDGLAPYLHKDVLENLENDVLHGSKGGTPTPLATP